MAQRVDVTDEREAVAGMTEGAARLGGIDLVVKPA
jgi:hypothetical protein